MRQLYEEFLTKQIGVTIALPTWANARTSIFRVVNHGFHGQGAANPLRIAGNAVTVTLRGMPPPAFSGQDATARLQVWVGGGAAWVNVASTLLADNIPPNIVIEVNVEGLIASGFFASEVERLFRVVVTNVDAIEISSALDDDPTGNPDQGDRQGPLRLIPLANAAFAAAPALQNDVAPRFRGARLPTT